jgi:hypothetical protein
LGFLAGARAFAQDLVVALFVHSTLANCTEQKNPSSPNVENPREKERKKKKKKKNKKFLELITFYF